VEKKSEDLTILLLDAEIKRGQRDFLEISFHNEKQGKSEQQMKKGEGLFVEKKEISMTKQTDTREGVIF